MTLINAKLSLVALSALFTAVHCVCQKTYITKCPSFEDLKNYKDGIDVEEVLIGTESGEPQMTPITLTDVHKFKKLSTVYFVNAINKLEPIKKIPYRKSSLSYVNFYGNVLKTIDVTNFPKFRLRKLSLVNNQIETVKENTFTGHRIDELDLSDNRLEVIESGSLPVTSKIVTIRNNRLVYLQENSFHQRLQSLDLGRNFLRDIKYEVFEELVSMKNLDLSHNKFSNIPMITRMHQLKIFDISHNQVTGVRLSTFRNMSSLVLIDLSYNNIYSPGTLVYLNSLKTQYHVTILLAGNELRTISGERKMAKKTYSLYGNPWYCQDFTRLIEKFDGHLTKCDAEFSNQGDTPYCVDFYEKNEVYVPSQMTRVKNFREMVMTNAEKFNCAEDLKKEKKLAVMKFASHVCYLYRW